MTSRSHPLIRFMLMIAIGILLLRLLPFIARGVQGAAIGLGGYGWIVLGALVTVWVVRKKKQQRLRKNEQEPVNGRRTVHVVSQVRDANDTDS